jgi:hypothetical protein
MNIVVLDGYTTNPGDCSWDPVAEFGRLEVFERTAIQEIQRRAGNAEVVLTNKTPLSAEILAELPHLKLISVLATGVNVVEMWKLGKNLSRQWCLVREYNFRIPCPPLNLLNGCAFKHLESAKLCYGVPGTVTWVRCVPI